MKYQFYAIVFDVAGNQVSSRSVSSPLSIASAIQLVTGLTINPTVVQVKNVGQTFTITPTITPSNANNKNVNWTSSNTNVATVSKSSTASGTAITVTCKAAGTASITATAADGSGKSASLSLTVNQPVTGILLSQTTAALATGDTLNLTATVIPSTANNKTVTWTSSNTNIATVSNIGVVTIKKMGNVTITATCANGIKATCNITPAWILTTIGNSSATLVENPSTSNPTKLCISGSGQNSEVKLTYLKTIPANSTVSITFMGKRNTNYYISMWVNGEDHYLSGGYNSYYPNYANFNVNTKYTYNYQNGASPTNNWYVSLTRGVTDGYDAILEIYSILLNGNRIL